MNAPSFLFKRCGLASVLAALLTAGAAAQTGASPGTQALDQAVLTLIEGQPQDGEREEALVIDQPAQVRHELGAVLDPNPEGGGPLRVIAVTPGRAAQRMGLQVDDRILAARGEALAEGEAGARALARAIEDQSRPLDLTVLRGGERLELSGFVDVVAVPAYRLEVAPRPPGSCGRVSVAAKPPVSEDIYALVLHEIDGRLPGPLDATSWRLPAGRHVLKVSELIQDNRFTFNQNRKRGQLFRHERFKYLDVDIKPDTTYRLGVKLDREQIDPVRSQGYWTPVIWKEINEPCH